MSVKAVRLHLLMTKPGLGNMRCSMNDAEGRRRAREKGRRTDYAIDSSRNEQRGNIEAGRTQAAALGLTGSID